MAFVVMTLIAIALLWYVGLRIQRQHVINELERENDLKIDLTDILGDKTETPEEEPDRKVVNTEELQQLLIDESATAKVKDDEPS